MRLVSLGPRFAAEVRGVDLIDVATDDAAYCAVREAFEEHSVRRCHTNLDRRGEGFGRRADLRPLWRLATSGTLRLLGREAYGGK